MKKYYPFKSLFINKNHIKCILKHIYIYIKKENKA